MILLMRMRKTLILNTKYTMRNEIDWRMLMFRFALFQCTVEILVCQH